MATRIIQNEIERNLLKDIQVPLQSSIDLYIVTEEDLYESKYGDDIYKNMIGCFRTFDKAKWFIDFKNENNTDSEYKYEIKTIKLTKDAEDYLFLPERLCITPAYKDTLTIKNILKYLAKLQNIEKIFSED
tara:strand:+ start:27573 stop:27965 length:393 start_codon:yes stop_codon:yes gene_type:complete